jgi:membrane fusion protein, multidrug efflux system
MRVGLLRAAAIAVLLAVPGLAAAQPKAFEARGIVQPDREATVSVEIAARIVELKLGPGERFREGEILARLDCRFYDARLAQALAARDASKMQLDSDRELSLLRSIGQLDVMKSEANLRAAEAEVTLRRVDVTRCSVAAPFAGRVVERRANAHESVNAGAPLFDIVDERSLRVRAIVPAGWLVWLKPGQAFRFAIDETGETRQARVRDLGARIDPVSQTVPIIATIDRPAEGLVAGMSGTAKFDPPPAGAGGQRPGG